MLQVYPDRGIWGAFETWLSARESKTARGRFAFLLPWPGGVWRLSTGVLPEFLREQVNDKILVRPVPGGNRVSLPLVLAGRVVLCVEFTVTQLLEDNEILLLRELLQLLLQLEAADPELHPTWLPFMLPLGGDLSSNGSLVEQKRLYFLNGQPGSGKTLFVRCCRMHHRAGQGAGWPTDLLVPEIALLDEPSLMAALQLPGPIFVGSAYEPGLLVKRGLLANSQAEILQGHRVILHSLRTAPQISSELEELWRVFKNFPACPAGSPGTVQQWKQAYFSNRARIRGWPAILEKSHDLRGAIDEFERQAVIFAREAAGNSQHKVSRFLGISRGSLQHKLRKWNLSIADD